MVLAEDAESTEGVVRRIRCEKRFSMRVRLRYAGSWKKERVVSEASLPLRRKAALGEVREKVEGRRVAARDIVDTM